jgi:hypothetical protein
MMLLLPPLFVTSRFWPSPPLHSSALKLNLPIKKPLFFHQFDVQAKERKKEEGVKRMENKRKQGCLLYVLMRHTFLSHNIQQHQATM